MQRLLALRDHMAQAGQRRSRATAQQPQRHDDATVAGKSLPLSLSGPTEQTQSQHHDRSTERTRFTLPQPWQARFEGAIQQQNARQAASPSPSTKRTPSGTAADRPLGPAEIRRESQTVSPLMSQGAQVPQQAVQQDRIRPSTEGMQTSLEPLRQSQDRQHIETQLQEGEAVYVEGAGVIIVHPFLEELFRSLGLLQERAFYDQAAQYQAVHLLSYLTFGNDEIPEYDLLLPKLLCGLPWAEPLPPSGTLSTESCNACEELLSAVLNHWSALKSNSSAWLRQQFFLRQGKIERVDEHWKLSVERRPQDVLLDKLPWGVGLIHLPWMPGLLHVSY